MRDEAIVLLAAASSMMFLVAGARAQSDLHPRENISRESLLAQSPPRWSDSIDDLEARRIVNSVRMITWNVCSAPSSGSAFSIYSIYEKAARLLPVSAMQDDVGNDLCAGDDD